VTGSSHRGSFTTDACIHAGYASIQSHVRASLYTRRSGGTRIPDGVVACSKEVITGEKRRERDTSRRLQASPPEPPSRAPFFSRSSVNVVSIGLPGVFSHSPHRHGDVSASCRHSSDGAWSCISRRECSHGTASRTTCVMGRRVSVEAPRTTAHAAGVALWRPHPGHASGRHERWTGKRPPDGPRHSYPNRSAGHRCGEESTRASDQRAQFVAMGEGGKGCMGKHRATRSPVMRALNVRMLLGVCRSVRDVLHTPGKRDGLACFLMAPVRPLTTLMAPGVGNTDEGEHGHPGGNGFTPRGHPFLQGSHPTEDHGHRTGAWSDRAPADRGLLLPQPCAQECLPGERLPADAMVRRPHHDRRRPPAGVCLLHWDLVPHGYLVDIDRDLVTRRVERLTRRRCVGDGFTEAQARQDDPDLSGETAALRVSSLIPRKGGTDGHGARSPLTSRW
jgi:hypothetical protein